jgi:hypothetical protein
MRRLDEAQLEISASLWLYMPDKNLWRPLIASPSVRKEGPKKVYQKIQTALSKMSDDAPQVLLQDMSAVEDTHPLISSLKVSMCFGGVSGRRLSRSTINGHFIEDAYIYRVA